MWNDLLAAGALVLVIEGLLPFLSPGASRKTLLMMAEMNDKKMRVMGLMSMVAGVILLYVVR